MRVVYQSATYTPERVSGVYVRCTGTRGRYRFRHFEACDGLDGVFKGQPGYGPTIREYITDGEDLDADFRQRLITEKTTLKLERKT